ncbi:hypothetical protein Q1695_006090 [Nippostrongylus brasiliensis]|nr:hypothetical protein Q1695_006090 [Nippostrongylus brasiliensis]
MAVSYMSVPIRAPIAALKLKVDMTKWNGSDVVELLTINERKALGLEAAVSESVKAKDNDSANGVPIQEGHMETSTSFPTKRKRTLSDFISSK